jgi:hypothetical protein
MTDKRERTTGLLPLDSSRLFQDRELQEHDFARSSFTEDDVGTSVTEFDLANVDTSNAETMSNMFKGASSFNQDISSWCVEQITQKPPLSDYDAGFEGVNANWGDGC